jgi:serine/threonine-protein kinase
MKQATIQPQIKYVLHPDIFIVPYADLSEDQRTQTGISPTDAIITKKGGRNPSKAVTAEMLKFIEQFKTPVTYVEAISNLANETKQDAEQLLENALSFTQQFLSIQFIVSEDEADVETLKPHYEAGDFINDYEIVKNIQAFEDTEVYLVKNKEDNTNYALKIVRSNQDKKTLKALTRETDILKSIKGTHHVNFVKEGYHKEQYFFTTEWCPYKNLKDISKTLNCDHDSDKPKILELCIQVLKAFEALHNQKCFHGDIHYKNILFNVETMSAKIIDFGRSYKEDACEKMPGRGGVAYFFEPEHAAEMVHRKNSPLSIEGEQFSITAVLYFIITGNHYADFSVEKEKMLEQISNPKSRSFEDINKKPWPELERIFAKALQKNPAHRYPSLTDMILDLESIIQPAIDEDDLPPYYKSLMNLLKHPDDTVFKARHKGPKSSIVFGAGGVAYSLLKMSFVEDCSEKLFLADIWMNKALNFLDQHDGLYSEELELTQKVVPESSFYYGRSGVYAVQAILAHSMGDEATYNSAIQQYTNIVESLNGNEQLELNMGLAGILLGCCLIIEHTQYYDTDLIVAGKSLYETLIDRINDTDISEMTYLGIAHGWGGVYLSMIRWANLNKEKVHNSVTKGLSTLVAQSEMADGFSVLPMKLSRKPKFIPWWCNGATGLIHLWLAAYEHFQEDAYLKAAAQAGNFVWKSSENINMQDLCCGQAGWAYGFLSLYQKTQDAAWLEKAEHCCDILKKNVVSSPFLFGTYKGSVGILALLEDIKNPNQASMPLFSVI